jgi:hypothetical protein
MASPLALPAASRTEAPAPVSFTRPTRPPVSGAPPEPVGSNCSSRARDRRTSMALTGMSLRASSRASPAILPWGRSNRSGLATSRPLSSFTRTMAPRRGRLGARMLAALYFTSASMDRMRETCRVASGSRRRWAASWRPTAFCPSDAVSPAPAAGAPPKIVARSSKSSSLDFRSPRRNGALAPGVDRQHAGHVAVADAAAEAGDVPDFFVARELASQLVGRCVRQGHAGEVVEIREVGAARRDIGREAPQIEGLGDRALGGDARGAGPDVGVERIGTIRPHIQQRPAGDVQREGRAVDRAFASQDEASPGPALAFGGLHGRIECQPALFVGEPQLAVLDLEVPDRRHAERFALGFALLERPVGAALCVADQDEVGLGDLQPRGG